MGESCEVLSSLMLKKPSDSLASREPGQASRSGLPTGHFEVAVMRW